MQSEATTQAKEFRPARPRALRGRSAVSQARVILLVMINVAQLWILAATVEAALARHYRVLAPLVIASFICWLITLSIALWWRPASGRHTSTGYIRQQNSGRDNP
jgi:hypothetical protein